MNGYEQRGKNAFKMFPYGVLLVICLTLIQKCREEKYIERVQKRLARVFIER
jgi:hypothetical protein